MENFSSSARRLVHCLWRQCKSVIQPREALKGIGFVTFAEHLPVDVTADTVRVIDIPNVARFECHARGTHDTGVFVQLECCLKVAICDRNAMGETEPILDRHAGTLCERLQGRM